MANESEVGKMKGMVEEMVRHLVDEEQAVVVKESRASSLLLFEISVAPDDFGKLIGRGGEHAKAMRLLLKSAGRKLGLNVQIDILDPKGIRMRQKPPSGAPSVPNRP